MQCDIGVVGLGVMGANLALNMERNGFRIAGYDLEAAKGQAFVAGPAAGRGDVVPAGPGSRHGSFACTVTWAWSGWA